MVPLPPISNPVPPEVWSGVEARSSTTHGAFYGEFGLSDDDEDDEQTDTRYRTSTVYGQSSFPEEEDGSQSDDATSQLDFDEGESECQVFDLLTVRLQRCVLRCRWNCALSAPSQASEMRESR